MPNGPNIISYAVFQVRQTFKGDKSVKRFVLSQRKGQYLPGERYIAFVSSDPRADVFPPAPSDAPLYALLPFGDVKLGAVLIKDDRVTRVNADPNPPGGLARELKRYEGGPVAKFVSDITANIR
jgi:hypothetical protein